MEDDLTSLFGVPMSAPASAPAPDPSQAMIMGSQPTSQTVIPAGSTHPVPAPQSQHYVEQDGKHKGVAGIARDVLGTLGDFLLTRLHMKPMYWPSQENRKLEAAAQGFDQDPLGAINRVQSVDYQAGMNLRNQFIDNQRLAAAQESTQEARNSRLALAQSAANDRTRGTAAAMMNSMVKWDDPKRTSQYPALRARVLQYANNNHLDLSSELPETYDPDAIDSFIDHSVPVGTQRAQRLTAERNDVLENQGDVRNANVRRGQDLTHEDRQASNATTQQGNALRNSATLRGQDLAHGDRQETDRTRQRGQDIHSRDVRRGQDMRPHRQPQEGDHSVVGGVPYTWRNGKAVRD